MPSGNEVARRRETLAHSTAQFFTEARPHAHTRRMRFPVLATVLFVCLGVALGGIVGYFPGYWVGGIATRRCFEMDCLFRGLWAFGGVVVGAVFGGLSAWRFRRSQQRRLTEEART
jgi:hypothetical protein